MPAMIFTRVDFPAPLSPIRPTTSPAATVKSISDKARMAPNSLLTPCNLRSVKSLSLVWLLAFNGRIDVTMPKGCVFRKPSFGPIA
ncbi:hypothetical protein CHELA41_24192 [Hyphomicrobiales bacterium]|nr:hypothetical protein CHELA41_24192 [Hyphomicrobiales bacterium]